MQEEEAAGALRPRGACSGARGPAGREARGAAGAVVGPEGVGCGTEGCQRISTEQRRAWSHLFLQF